MQKFKVPKVKVFYQF